MPEKSRAGLGIVLALVAMFAFAAMDAVSKKLAGSLAIIQIQWVRYALFTAMALVMLRGQGPAKLRASQRPWLQLTRALVAVIESGTFVLAFKFLPLADVHAIAAASPLIVIALSVPMFGEQVGPRRWLAVIVGFLGVLLIVRPGFHDVGWGVVIALAGALLWAIYQVMVRLCLRTDDSDTTWLWTAVVGLAATTMLGPFAWTWPEPQGWLMLLAIAVLGSGAHLALIKALDLVEAGALQPYSYTLLLWAAVIGYFAFGDVPDVWTFAGAGLILASGLYAWHRERTRARI